MNKDKHSFINYRLFRILAGLLLVNLFIISTLEFGDKYSNEIGIIVVVITSVLGVLGFLSAPHYCKITPEGVEIGFFFGVKASAEWKNIIEIYKHRDISYKFLNVYKYVFIGLEGNCKYPFLPDAFYVSKKMTALLEQYAKNKLEKR